APADDGGQNYRQILPIYPFAVVDGGEAPGVYSAVGRTATLTFRVNDVFGNALDDETGTAPFPILYADPLLTPGEWPGVRSGYRFAATPSPSLNLALQFRPDFLAPGTAPSAETVKENAGAALLRYRTILAQAQDPNTRLALATTVLPALSAGGPAMLGRLAAFAGQVAAALQGVAQSGSITGVQPIDCALAAPIDPTQLAGRTDDVFPVVTTLTLSRDAALVDPLAARRLPAALSATQTVAAQLDAPAGAASGADPSTVTLTAFAMDFEAAFQGFDGGSGTAKLAVRSDTAGAGGPPAAESLWAMRWSATAGIMAAFTDPRAAYFTLAPLSTSPVNGAASVSSYDAQLNPVTTTQTFTAVGLDGWASAFLETVDGVLSADTAMALAQLAPDSFHALMAAKAQLAAAVAGGVVPVFQPSDTFLAPGDPAAATDRFEQALLGSLAAAYTVSAVVQVPAAVSVAGTAESGGQAPPRFFGAVGEPGQAGAAPGRAYTSSTAKLVARDSGGPSPQYLTFVVSATSPGDETDLPLSLAFQVRFMEHQIDTADEDFGYVPSEWLRFVLPTPSLDLALQPVDVPVPSRGIPPTPVMQRQSAAQAAPETGRGPLGGVLEWDYSAGVTLMELQAQDDLWLQADYNLPLPRAGGPTALGDAPGITGRLAGLFAALASFNASWTVLQPLVQALPAARGAAPSGPAPAQVAAALVARVQAVADAWRALWMDMEFLAEAPPAKQTDLFVVRFQSYDAGTVQVFGCSDASGPDGLTWPTLNGVSWSVAPSPLPAGAQPPGPGQNWFTATYPFQHEGGTASLAVVFPEMDVLTRQTGRAECWRLRNASLSSNPALVANPALVYQTPVVGFSDPVVPLLTGGALGPFAPAGALSATLTPVLAQLAQAGAATGEPRTLKVSMSYRYPLATAPDGTALMGEMPVLLADGLSMQTDGAAQIAAQLAASANAWHGAVQPVTPAGAVLNLSYVVFATIEGARLPLVQLPEVRYQVPSGWWAAEPGG
ncbi:MAG TPA: hypothetical protein VF665_20405, partial [Longimicrobium sp.]|uniref:hypothetical protein n=1 Tax=Longimicrobium sp. TaxID=2029185 RepID=UPI002EDBB05E